MKELFEKYDKHQLSRRSNSILLLLKNGMTVSELGRKANKHFYATDDIIRAWEKHKIIKTERISKYKEITLTEKGRRLQLALELYAKALVIYE